MNDRALFYTVGVLIGSMATVAIHWVLRLVFRGQPEAQRRRR
jgi:hypothetical protein